MCSLLCRSESTCETWEKLPSLQAKKMKSMVRLKELSLRTAPSSVLLMASSWWSLVKMTHVLSTFNSLLSSGQIKLVLDERHLVFTNLWIETVDSQSHRFQNGKTSFQKLRISYLSCADSKVESSLIIHCYTKTFRVNSEKLQKFKRVKLCFLEPWRCRLWFLVNQKRSLISICHTHPVQQLTVWVPSTHLSLTNSPVISAAIS